MAIVSRETKPNDDRKKEENRDCRPVSYLIYRKIALCSINCTAKNVRSKDVYAHDCALDPPRAWFLFLSFFFFFKYRCEKSHLRDAKFIVLGCSPGTRGFESSPRGSNAARFENHVPEHGTGCGAERQAPKTVCWTRGCRGAGHGVCCPQSGH